MKFWWKTGSGSVIKTIYCYFEQGSAVFGVFAKKKFRVRDRDRDNLANVVEVKSNRKKNRQIVALQKLRSVSHSNSEKFEKFCQIVVFQTNKISRQIEVSQQKKFVN